MKKLIYSLFIAAATYCTMFGQITHFMGELKPINNTSVSGYFSGYYDYKTSIATVTGIASAYGVAVDTKPINSVKVPLLPTSGLIYNLEKPTFSVVSVNKTSESTVNNIIDVHGYKLYISFKNEFVALTSSFKALPATNYTFLLNSGVLPVAYGTFFVPIPEPTVTVSAAGMGLLGFGLFRLKQKNK